MDEQEFFNKIKELQKQRDLLKKDVTVLECKINELRDILELKNIKKGYYTNNLGLFCKVYDIKGDNIHVYELDTTDLLVLQRKLIIGDLLKRHIIRNVLKKSMIKL